MDIFKSCTKFECIQRRFWCLIHNFKSTIDFRCYTVEAAVDMEKAHGIELENELMKFEIEYNREFENA